jgi:hypothetical protein
MYSEAERIGKELVAAYFGLFRYTLRLIETTKILNDLVSFPSGFQTGMCTKL